MGGLFLLVSFSFLECVLLSKDGLASGGAQIMHMYVVMRRGFLSRLDPVTTRFRTSPPQVMSSTMFGPRVRVNTVCRGTAII